MRIIEARLESDVYRTKNDIHKKYNNDKFKETAAPSVLVSLLFIRLLIVNVFVYLYIHCYPFLSQGEKTNLPLNSILVFSFEFYICSLFLTKKKTTTNIPQLLSVWLTRKWKDCTQLKKNFFFSWNVYICTLHRSWQ